MSPSLTFTQNSGGGGGGGRSMTRGRFPLVIAAALVAVTALVGSLVFSGGDAQAQFAVPAAPSGLTASAVSHDAVSLAWDDPADATISGYQVLRRSRDGDAYGDGRGAWEFVAVVADTASSATSYTDTTVTARTRYVYRVKAINPAGLGARSSYLNVETSDAPAAQTAPAAPTGLSASSVSYDAVSLAWDDAGDTTISGYEVLRRSRDGDAYGDGRGAWEFVAVVADTASPATSYTDTSVTARTRYVYRVKAINPAGLGARSSYLNIETPPAPAVPAPTLTVVELPEEPDEPPVAAQQLQPNVIPRGELAVGARGVFGTIESPGDRHRYRVALQAGRFYTLNICGCYGSESGFDKREMQLLDSDGNPVQDNGRDVISAPHRMFGGVDLYYQPTTTGTYLLEVRAGDDQQTGVYNLDAYDTTITASSHNEGPGSWNDFKPYIRRATLIPWVDGSDAEVSGNLNDDGDAHGVALDVDYFDANLYAGRTYEFRFSASITPSGEAPLHQSFRLVSEVSGPENYHTLREGASKRNTSQNQTMTFTPKRTGLHVFSIWMNSAGTSSSDVERIAPSASYTVRLTQQ